MMRIKFSRFLFLEILLGILALHACASHAPFKAITDAHQEIAIAKVAKADLYSPDDMHKANERIVKAEKLVFNYDYKKASTLAKEASAYAQLATARSKEKLSFEAMKEAEQSLVAVKDTLEVIERKLGMLPSLKPEEKEQKSVKIHADSVKIQLGN